MIHLLEKLPLIAHTHTRARASKRTSAHQRHPAHAEQDEKEYERVQNTFFAFFLSFRRIFFFGSILCFYFCRCCRSCATHRLKKRWTNTERDTHVISLRVFSYAAFWTLSLSLFSLFFFSRSRIYCIFLPLILRQFNPFAEKTIARQSENSLNESRKYECWKFVHLFFVDIVFFIIIVLFSLDLLKRQYCW